MNDDTKTTQRVAIIGVGMSLGASLLASLAARGIPAEVRDEPRPIEPWELPIDWNGPSKPINKGRRAEKDAAALAKAEAKRARKAAKRLKATGGASHG
jgi:hypothetical protein